MLNTHRNPNNGRAQSDISTARFGVECKKRRTLPAWLTKATQQARAGATGLLTPVTVLSLAPGPGVPIQRYVVLEFGDFLTLANGRDYLEAHADGGHEDQR